MASCSGDDNKEFKAFDVVDSCSDDHSFHKKSTNLSREAQKKITREWKILEESLPRGSIYVRAYEARIDLMRAVIVGAKGTPYHDGLYFFDLRLPSDYPNRPPEVKYRSHGMSINPNLYPNGKVCLSLLDTWIGSGSEKWDPSSSTVLQVLISIQGLVLNENPFFNEPMLLFVLGSWEKWLSQNYNERAFALSCKSALCLLRNKPRNFEDFVVSHYRDRAGTILEACRAYSSGSARVGFYGAPSAFGVGPRADVSDKFIKKVRELYELLVEAFEENCIVVSEDLVEFGVTNEAPIEEEEELGCGIIEWFRKVFKLKNM